MNTILLLILAIMVVSAVEAIIRTMAQPAQLYIWTPMYVQSSPAPGCLSVVVVVLVIVLLLVMSGVEVTIW